MLSCKGPAFGLVHGVFPQTSNHHGSNSSQSLDSSHEFGANLTTLEAEKQSRAEVSQDRESKLAPEVGGHRNISYDETASWGSGLGFPAVGSKGEEREAKSPRSNQTWAGHGSRCSRQRREFARRQVSELRTANFRETNYLQDHGLDDDTCLLYPRDMLRKRDWGIRRGFEANWTSMMGRAYEAMVKHRRRFQRSVSVLPSGTAFSLIFPGAGARMRMLSKV